ncbi:MAG TPA: alpha/beta hydrolase [Lactobacillaceae bacterium]|jgi:phospholipase/carboxylesterase
MTHEHEHQTLEARLTQMVHVTDGEVKYAYVPGEKDAPVLVLLHGTGGDELDLLNVAHFFSADNPILSIRGRVLENGYARFFARHGEGNFDLNSLHTEEAWLVQTVRDLAKKHGLSTRKMVSIGHSNGANVAAHALLHEVTTPWRAVVALHAMQLEHVAGDFAKDSQVFITWGKHDPIVSKTSVDALVADLDASGANTSVFRQASSHGVTNEELYAAQVWLHANELL